MATVTQIQNSLAAGELSPALFGRVDLEKWHSGTSTCRNFYIDYRGGAVSRAGLAYVGMCKQSGSAAPPRDIPFQFNIYQGYVLEFGDQYLRVKQNGAYVTEATKTVTSVSSAALFTTSGVHGYTVGDWVYDVGNTGFSALTWIVATTPTTHTFTVTDLFGNVISAATASTGGTVARIYTQTAPYAAVDLFYLKYTQSADVMTLCCVNTDTDTEYPPYSLARISNTDWVFTQDTFASSIAAPTGLTITAQSSAVATTWYSYVVTAVDTETGEESNASLPINIQNNDISISAGSNQISWTAVTNAASYNVYASTPSYGLDVPVSSLFGFIGTALGPEFTDTNIQPDFTVVPPVHNDPFAQSQITEVVPTAGGSNYSTQTIGYSITTSTGSGFAGTPVVGVTGTFNGFVIYNSGYGYAPGDTITITDSGGGLATGTFALLTVNPTDGDVAYFNGIKVEFKNAPYSGQGSSVIFSEIENTIPLTIQTLANTLNSATILSLLVATYTASGNTLTVTYKTPGTVGNAYTLDASSSHGTVSGANLTGGGTSGTGATATLTISPASGTYPGVPAYFQQRRVYASSLNNPDTYWMSQPGLFLNMDSSIPVTDADSITGTPWAQEVNGLQFLVPMPGGLVILTGLGAWQLNGGAQAAVTPSNQDATPQAYNGCHNHVPPIVINYDILYVQAKGSIIRDLSYNFFVNIYTGTDLTVLSNHLFNNYQINQWAYAQEPYKLVWAVRNDGIVLCLTYLKEQDVYAWSRHDTNGLFQGVCSVTEFLQVEGLSQSAGVDAVYFIVKRFVQGNWYYYAERMDDRIWTEAEDAFCVDAGLATTLIYPNATLSPASATGTNVAFTASASVFSSGDVGQVIRVDGGFATVISYTSGTLVNCNITTALSQTIPNDPNLTPIPAPATTWSIAPQITTVTNLNHLEGLEVAILADGSVVDNQIVTNNSVILPAPASYIKVGLPYTCQLQTLYLDHPEGGNTSQNKRKTISAVGVRVEATRGLQIGADQPDQSVYQNSPTQLPWTDMNEIKERNNLAFMGNAIPLYTGDHYKAITSGWDVKGQIAVQQIYPLPANVLSLISYFTIGDDK